MKKVILILLLFPLIASAQSFNVFDIDTSEYPIMKAKFYSVDENGDQILNHTTSDFEITENGNPAEVLSVSCPEPNSEPVSFVIAVDVSGSMSGEEIVTLKNSLKYFIDIVPNDDSEMAIIAFNSSNHYISDFTKNKEKLKSSVNTLSVSGGTDFDAAFIDPVAGALLAMEKAKHTNRNVIIITDGMATGDKNAIIKKANSLGTRVFGILIKNNIPSILKHIINETNGESFENIIDEDDFKEHFLNIRQIVGNNPCEIVWESNETCNDEISLEILNSFSKLFIKDKIIIKNELLGSLNLSLEILDFGLEKKDTTIRIESMGIAQLINKISFKPDLGNYEIITDLPILVEPLESKEIKIRFTNEDKSREYCVLTVEGEYCKSEIPLISGDKNLPFSRNFLKLEFPNGGEKFVAGTDTIINWEGSLSDRDIIINFSDNQGLDWSSISSNATGSYKQWNVPKIASDNCLIQIEQVTSTSSNTQLSWGELYGGFSLDYASDAVITEEGSILIVGYTESRHINLNTLDKKGKKDLLLLYVDENGKLIWSKNLGSTKDDYATCAIEVDDGSFIVGGIVNFNDEDIKDLEYSGESDCLIIKISKEGKILWKKTYGFGKRDEINTIIRSDNSNYILAGRTTSHGKEGYPAYDSWFLKIDSNGKLIWSEIVGGKFYDEEVKLIPFDEYLYSFGTVSYHISGNNFDYNISLRKLDLYGDVIWTKSYGIGGKDIVMSATKTFDGGLLSVGYTDSDKILNKDGSNNIFIIKFDENGEIIWSSYYGGSGSDAATSVFQNEEGNFIVVGNSNSVDGDFPLSISNNVSDLLLLEIGKNGELLSFNNYGGDQGDYGKLVFPVNQNYFITIASSSSDNRDLESKINYGKGDIWVCGFLKLPPPLQSDTSDAVFSIIMPEPVIQNNDIDMGEMIVGNTKDTIVSSVICNTGDAPLHVLVVDITGGDDIDFLIPRGAGDFYLKKDQCQDMMFEFTPSALGNRTAVATIRTTIGDFTDTINIRGVGIDPLIEATTDVVDFGQFELREGKDTNVVLIKNVGVDDITITETKITGPDTEQFDMVPLPSFSLASGEDKELELNYTAIYGGRTSSIIEFHYDGVGSPLRSMLFAEGIGGEVYPQVPDAFVGERVELGLHLGRIKPDGLDEVATNFTATVSYNSTLLAPIDKNMTVTTENITSFIEIEGQLSGVSQIATVPMKVGLGTAVSSGLVVTEFQLYDSNGDSVDYEIEPGVGEFNVLGICEEGGTRLVNPNSEKVGLRVAQNKLNTSATIYLDLIESGQTDLIVYDQLGNAIETAYSGIPSTGSKELSLDLSYYTNGRYYIKLTTPTITKTEIIEVVR